MSTGKLPVASASEWRFHKAHSVSAFQVIGRLYMGGSFVWIMGYALALSTHNIAVGLPPLSGLAWGPISADVAMRGAIWILGLVLPLVWILLLLTPGAITTGVAARLHAAALWRWLAEEINSGFEEAGAHPLPVAEAAPILLLSAVTALALPGVAVVMGGSLMATAPIMIVPVLALAIVASMMVVGRWLLSDLVDVEVVARAAATLVGRLQSVRLRAVPAESECPVCLGSRRVRPWIRRAYRAVAGWVSNLVAQGAERSVWIATLRAYRWVVVPTAVAGLVIGSFWLSGADLIDVTWLASLYVGILILGVAVWGSSGSIFETMFDPSRINLGLLLGALGAAWGLMLNAQALRKFVWWLEGGLGASLSNFDTDMAMLFLLSVEGCLAYMLYAMVMRRFGRRTRWSPRRVASRSFLPLVGLATSAITGSWFFIAVILGIGAFAAYTEPYRAHQRKARELDGQ